MSSYLIEERLTLSTATTCGPTRNLKFQVGPRPPATGPQKVRRQDTCRFLLDKKTINRKYL